MAARKPRAARTDTTPQPMQWGITAAARLAHLVNPLGASACGNVAPSVWTDPGQTRRRCYACAKITASERN